MTTELDEALDEIGDEAAWRALQVPGPLSAFRLLAPRPSRLRPALRQLGVGTLAQAVELSARLQAALGERWDDFLTLAAPSLDPNVFDYSAMRQIRDSEVHKAVWDAMPERGDWNVLAEDGWYKLPSLAQVEHIAARMPVMSHEGGERWDCDNQVRDVSAWLARQGLGNLAHGLMGLLLKDARDRVRGHAVMFFVLDDLSVRLLDCGERVLRQPDFVGYLDETVFGIPVWQTASKGVTVLRF